LERRLRSEKRKPTNKDNLQARKGNGNKIVANDGMKKIKIP